MIPGSGGQNVYPADIERVMLGIIPTSQRWP
jgi:hypothetical protein